MKKIIFLLIVFIFKTNIAAQCWKSVSGEFQLKTDGTLWSYGNAVVSGTFQDISTRNITAQYGINLDGKLISWQNNSNYYQTLDNNTDWSVVSAGQSFGIAKKTNGTLWSWGVNDYGQLGDNTYNNRDYILQVGTDSNWQSISAGKNFCFAIKSDGSLWNWGYRYNNQPGMLTTPTQISTDTDWFKIESGYRKTIAMKTNGSLWIIDDSNVLTQISTENNWVAIANGEIEGGGPHGSYYVISAYYALKSDGSIWAIGNYDWEISQTTDNNPTELTQLANFPGSYENIFAGRGGRLYGLTTNSSLWTRTLIGPPSTIILSQVDCVNLGVNEILATKNEFQIYPNPTSGILNISSNSNIQNKTVTIFNLLGEQIITKNNVKNNIDLSELIQGIYIIEISSNDHYFKGKFIKY